MSLILLGFSYKFISSPTFPFNDRCTNTQFDSLHLPLHRQLKSRGYEHGDDGKFNVHDFVRDNTKARSVCAQCRNM